MARLNQLLAIKKGAKSRSESVVSKAYKSLEKTDPLRGFSRTHVPLDAEAVALPPEGTKVQSLTSDIVASVKEAMANLIDVSSSIDSANQKAVADVVVDGKVIASKVPVTSLLSIEKKLVELHAFLAKLPHTSLGCVLEV